MEGPTNGKEERERKKKSRGQNGKQLRSLERDLGRRGEAEHCVDVCLCSSFGRCSSKAEPRPSLGNDAAGHNTLQWPTVYGRPITARRNYISNSEVTGCPNSTNHFKQLLLKLIRMSGFDCVHAWDWGWGGGVVFLLMFSLCQMDGLERGEQEEGAISATVQAKHQPQPWS